MNDPFSSPAPTEQRCNPLGEDVFLTMSTTSDV